MSLLNLFILLAFYFDVLLFPKFVDYDNQTNNLQLLLFNAVLKKKRLLGSARQIFSKL